MRAALAITAAIISLAHSGVARAEFDEPTRGNIPWQVLSEQEGAVSVLGHSPGLVHTQGWELGFLSRANLKGATGEGGFVSLLSTRLGRLGLGVGGGLHGAAGASLTDPSRHQFNAGAALRLSRSLAVGARFEQLNEAGQEPFETWSSGITYEPIRHLSLAVSVDRLNTPRRDDVRQRPVLSGAVGFRPGTERVGFAIEGATEMGDDGDWRVGGSLRLMPVEGLSVGGYGRFVSREGADDHLQWGVSLALSQGNVGAETSLDLVDSADGTGGSSMTNRTHLRITGQPGTRLFRRSRAFVRVAIDGPIPEAPRGGFLSKDVAAFGSWIIGLNRLAEAPDVDGVLLDIKAPTKWGQAWEIRQAVHRMQAEGKVVFARVASADMRAMYLAASADHILLHPAGSVNTPGLALTRTYLVGLLDKLGVGAQVIRFEGYKTAFDSYIRSGPSEKGREQTRQLLTTFQQHWDRAVSSGRKLNTERLAAAVTDAPHSVASAHQSGLVDRVVHDDELKEAMGEILGEDVRILKRYRPTPRAWRPWGRGSVVAVIPVVGTIMNGSGKGNAPLLGTYTSDGQVVSALQRAARDSSIAGIVVRVSSPGGAVLASDRMHRAVTRAAEKKPLVVSFGDTAASGGYYLACGAPHVISTPLTITGSIGVIAAKLHLDSLYAKIGATTSTERTGDQADAQGTHRPWTEKELAANHELVGSWYQRFVRLVAEGRGMTAEVAAERAQGRVYTGSRALALGLVDEHGSLWDAVQEIRTRAGLADDAPVRVQYPRGDSSVSLKGVAAELTQGSVPGTLVRLPWLRWVASLETLAAGQALAQLPVEIEIR